MPLYLAPFTSYLASKLTIVEKSEKYSKIQHIWPSGGATYGTTCMTTNIHGDA